MTYETIWTLIILTNTPQAAYPIKDIATVKQCVESGDQVLKAWPNASYACVPVRGAKGE